MRRRWLPPSPPYLPALDRDGPPLIGSQIGWIASTSSAPQRSKPVNNSFWGQRALNAPPPGPPAGANMTSDLTADSGSLFFACMASADWARPDENRQISTASMER